MQEVKELPRYECDYVTTKDIREAFGKGEEVRLWAPSCV